MERLTNKREADAQRKDYENRIKNRALSLSYSMLQESFLWFEHEMMEHDKYLMQELYGKQCQMFNVGAMMPYMDYTPRTIDEILKGAS